MEQWIESWELGKNLKMEIPKKVKENKKERMKMERDGDVFLEEKRDVNGGETENNWVSDLGLGVKLMNGFLIILADDLAITEDSFSQIFLQFLGEILMKERNMKNLKNPLVVI